MIVTRRSYLWLLTAGLVLAGLCFFFVGVPHTFAGPSEEPQCPPSVAGMPFSERIPNSGVFHQRNDGGWMVYCSFIAEPTGNGFPPSIGVHVIWYQERSQLSDEICQREDQHDDRRPVQNVIYSRIFDPERAAYARVEGYAPANQEGIEAARKLMSAWDALPCPSADIASAAGSQSQAGLVEGEGSKGAEVPTLDDEEVAASQLAESEKDDEYAPGLVAVAAAIGGIIALVAAGVIDRQEAADWLNEIRGGTGPETQVEMTPTTAWVPAAEIASEMPVGAGDPSQPVVWNPDQPMATGDPPSRVRPTTAVPSVAPSPLATAGGPPAGAMSSAGGASPAPTPLPLPEPDANDAILVDWGENLIDAANPPPTFTLPSAVVDAMQRAWDKSLTEKSPDCKVLEHGATLVRYPNGAVGVIHEDVGSITGFRPDYGRTRPEVQTVFGSIHTHPYDDGATNVACDGGDIMSLFQHGTRVEVLQSGNDQYVMVRSNETPFVSLDEYESKILAPWDAVFRRHLNQTGDYQAAIRTAMLDVASRLGLKIYHGTGGSLSLLNQ